MKKDLSVTFVCRMDTESEVKKFIEEEKEKAIQDGYTLDSYSSKYKQKKDRKTKDVVDFGYEVKVTRVYNEFWED